MQLEEAKILKQEANEFSYLQSNNIEELLEEDSDNESSNCDSSSQFLRLPLLRETC